jgi:hypothetical protein
MRQIIDERGASAEFGDVPGGSREGRGGRPNVLYVNRQAQSLLAVVEERLHGDRPILGGVTLSAAV